MPGRIRPQADRQETPRGRCGPDRSHRSSVARSARSHPAAHSLGDPTRVVARPLRGPPRHRGLPGCNAVGAWSSLFAVQEAGSGRSAPPDPRRPRAPDQPGAARTAALCQRERARRSRLRVGSSRLSGRRGGFANRGRSHRTEGRLDLGTEAGRAPTLIRHSGPSGEAGFLAALPIVATFSNPISKQWAFERAFRHAASTRIQASNPPRRRSASDRSHFSQSPLDISENISTIKCMTHRLQLELDLTMPVKWGGAREGAGRKAAARPRVWHRGGREFPKAHPGLVTIRVRGDVPSLRTLRFIREIERSLRETLKRRDFRVVHYSLQHDHVHLLVEAEGAAALSKGMKSLAARLARAVNRVFDRRGAVLDGRYHHRALGTPREVRAALAYVLLNVRKHAQQRAPTPRDSGLGVDPASSGRWYGPSLSDSSPIALRWAGPRPGCSRRDGAGTG